MGLMDGISEFFGTKNEEKAKGFADSEHYNPNAHQFGPGGAGAYNANREAQAAGVDQRGAFQANYAMADQDRANAMAARTGQGQAAGLMMARATGQTPSIAGMQAQQDMQRAVAAQSSAAAGARGPAALALAQQNAAANTANAQSAISGQAQINAANERMQAEQAAFGAMSGMRGQDFSSQAQAANQAQFQAGMQMQNRQANDARAMQYAQMGHQALGQEQQGAVQMQGMLAGNQAATNQTNAQIGGQNAGMNAGLLGGMVGLGQSAAGGIANMMSDARAKQGAIPMGDGMMSDVTSKTGLAQVGGIFDRGPMMAKTLGGGSGPSQGHVIGGAFHSGTAQIGPDGGMDTDFGTKWNNRELHGMAADPSGGLVARGGPAAGIGTMLSDDRAKVRDAERQAYLLGRAHEMEGSKDFAYGGRPRQGEEIIDRDPWMSDARRAEQRPEWLESFMADQGRNRAADHYAAQPAMSEMTGQLARGLAPYAYQYKPGFGTEGQKVGPMAQDMASNDVTATAVRRDPQTGLLSIDRDDGLKVALGGVGHLASKQAQQESLIAALLADRERPNRRY